MITSQKLKCPISSSIISNMKYLVLLFIFCLTFSQSYGQSKKELSSAKVKSSTEWSTKKEDGKTTNYKSLYEEYDKNGNTTLSIEYDEAGNQIHKEVVVYDKFKRVTSETVFDASKEKTVRKSYIYDAFNNVKEEMEYNGDKLIKKVVNTYNADGNKTSESTFDGLGELLKKVTFSYDAKKLKSGKTTTNPAKGTETVKKWTYTFF